MPTISVIIMTLNAEEYIASIISHLHKQTVMPDEIIIADSESEDQTVALAKKDRLVKILNIKRKEFDHGGSRDYALKESIGDYVLFFTQDAVIGDKHYIENIVKNFEDDGVAMVCGRQVARKNAKSYEKLIRDFNYPSTRKVREEKDIETMGVKAFFMSDVCSAYRRTAYFDIGGFEHPILTNEDMLIAFRALKKGYKTVYDPKAYVYHSHNFTLKQEYERNKIVGEFMTQYKDEFGNISVNGEGLKLVKYVSKKLLGNLRIISFIHFGLICVAKFTGNKAGKRS